MILAMGLSVQAAEKVDAGLGFGFQGAYAGNLVNGLSLRMAPGPVGGQILFGTWNGEIDAGAGLDAEARLWTIQGKLLFTLIEKDYTDFYAGAKIGYGWVDIDLPSGIPIDPDVTTWTYGILAGAEFFFAEIPEMGFNFEVGYDFIDSTIDPDIPGVSDIDLGLDGIFISLGMHYYF
jgi:hypothetical protein